MKAKLYRNREFSIDVFKEESLEGNAIEPLTTQNVLVKSKPITQKSRWETSETYNQTVYSTSGAVLTRNTTYFALNPTIVTKSDIDDSLMFLNPIETDGNFDDFRIIEAQNNLSKIKVDVNNLDLFFRTFSTDGGDGYLDVKLVLKYGSDYNTATEHVFTSVFLKNTSPEHNDTNNYFFEIPYLNRGDSVWLYYYGKLRQSRNSTNVNASMNVEITVNSMNVDVTATSIAYNTIVPSVRLKDAVNQVVKSTSGLDTSFPFAEPNGEMYNQRLFNGNLLRNLTDRAFNIKFDDITDWLQEINGGYEVNDNGLFLGLYSDFYANKEMGVFTGIRFDSFKKQMNERYAINQFSYKYKKYQSQKENEVSNTFDIPHGDTQWNVQNRFVENKKEVSVPFVRCSFYIDEQRRKAFDLTNDTSTQDDDTIFILDTKELNQDLEFTETDYLQHTYSDANGLKLTNTGNFSWILLGLRVGDNFRILNDDNAGVYTIMELNERYIILSNGSGNDDFNGERNTQFTYYVSRSTAPFISWSGEGFNYIDNIKDSDNFANLKYTIKRNIVRFYNEYLATCNLFAQKPIKNTEYKNNGVLSMSYEGVQTVENEPFTPSHPILSPYKYDITLIADFNTFMDLQNKTKTERGFIRFFDANGHVIKVYPKEMTFTKADEQGEIKIIGEGKHETSFIDIVYAGTGYLKINNEYRVRKLSYKIEGEKVYIMDESGLLLYNPVFWQKVTVNSISYESKEELIAALELLKQ